MFTPEHKREIRQLWFVADQYFKLAKQELKDSPQCNRYLLMTMSETKTWFAETAHVVGAQNRITMLLAHLSSASIRLCTIEERFEQENKPRFTPKYDAMFRKQPDSVDVMKDAFTLGKNNHMHQLLRDNAAHIEKDKSKNRAQIREARQHAIESFSVQEIVDAMTHILTIFIEGLRQNNVIQFATALLPEQPDPS